MTSFIPSVLSRARQRSMSPPQSEVREAGAPAGTRSHSACAEPDGEPASAALKAWSASLAAFTLAAQRPSILVVCHDGTTETLAGKGKSIREKVFAVNSGWLQLCEYEEHQVVGKSFAEIPGFQGPLTSEGSKLAFGCLLLKEEARAEGLKVVNYKGRSRQPVELKLDVDILRCGSRNLAFLCTIVEHAAIYSNNALPRVRRAAVGSACSAVVALRATSAKCLRVVTPGSSMLPERPHSASAAMEQPQQDGKESHDGDAGPRLPGLWQCLLDGHSQRTTASQSQQDLAREGMEACCICLGAWDSMDSLRVLACGHAFHRHCVDTWFHQVILEGPNGWVPAAFATPAIKKDISSPLACPMCKQDPVAVCPRYGAAKRPQEGDAQPQPLARQPAAAASSRPEVVPAAPTALPTCGPRPSGGRSYCKARAGMAELGPAVPAEDDAACAQESAPGAPSCSKEPAALMPRPPSFAPTPARAKRGRRPKASSEIAFDGVM